MILTALYGCDNVEWGGWSVELRQADPPPGALRDSIPADPEVVLAPLPDGPVLSVVEVDDAGARVIPVAEISGDSLRPLLREAEAPGFTDRFAQERLAVGTEFALFADGMRVGRFTVEGPAERDARYCAENLTAPGYLEVNPTAAGRQRFLALVESQAMDVPRGSVVDRPSDRGQRINTLRIYGELLNQYRARWPDDTQAARADLRIIQPPGGATTLASTFLFRDRLSVSPPGNSAHSIFFVAELEAGAYRPRYVWYRRADDEGKGVPRYLDHVDFDGDGSFEFVLDVLGATNQWFAVVNQAAAGWELTFQDECGQAVR